MTDSRINKPRHTSKKNRTFANGPNGKIPGTKPQAPEICAGHLVWGSNLSASHPYVGCMYRN